MIRVSMLWFPLKTSGQQIEAIAKTELWRAGRTFDHGLGHGVGSFLSVHEGPHSLSRRGATDLEPGVILSNEPGVYAADRYGVRIENLVLVKAPERPSAPDLPGDRDMLSFETLTLAPIDRRLIIADRLRPEERDWLNAYHARVWAEISPLLAEDDAATRRWLEAATAPIN